jgi:hypothetical protein
MYRNIFIQKIKKYLRGDIGKIILGSSMIKYFIYGVNNAPKTKKIYPYLLENVKNKRSNIKIINNSLKGFFETNIHRIDYTIKFKIIENKIHIIFNPIVIRILKHDIFCSRVIFPLIGDKCLNNKLNEMNFSGFIIKGNFKDFIIKDDFCGADQTLSTNWTHGGIYRGYFEIILNKNK